MGDSHVRRMLPYRSILDRKLAHIATTVTFVCQGGAHLPYVEHQLRDITRRYDILIVLAGGNDVSSGATSTYFQAYYQRLSQMAFNAGIRVVIVPSLWPRQNGWYNRAIVAHRWHFRSFFMGNPGVVFWEWDRRLPTRTFDGVHLLPNGYRRSVNYLFAMIKWAINNRLR